MKLKLYVENKDFCPLVSSMIGQGVQQYTLCYNTLLGAEALANAHFGSGTGPLLLSGLSCTGTERSLLSCHHSGIGVIGYNCTHRDAAGVRCQGIIFSSDCTNLESF